MGWGLAGLGMGLVYPTLSVLTLELSAPGEQGTNSSALQLCDSLFAVSAIALGGVIVQGTGWPPDPGRLPGPICDRLRPGSHRSGVLDQGPPAEIERALYFTVMAEQPVGKFRLHVDS